MELLLVEGELKTVNVIISTREKLLILFINDRSFANSVVASALDALVTAIQKPAEQIKLLLLLRFLVSERPKRDKRLHSLRSLPLPGNLP